VQRKQVRGKKPGSKWCVQEVELVPKVDTSGALFHAKHAFMPNKLGYCGPDDRGMILQCLRESSVNEKLVSTLKNFEAAYPFIHLIGKSNGRQPFDLMVTDAYWIGNDLLENVGAEEFYNFTLTELKKKNGEDIRSLFLNLRDRAMPHHTFYVISTTMNVISDSHHTSSPDPKKLSEVMDNCRISWGKVLKVEKDSLRVSYKPLGIVDGRLSLSSEKTKKIEYNPEVPPFEKVVPGDYVSIHWNFACEILTRAQVRNINAYTKSDIDSANLFLRVMKRVA
jgi:hypothetical protein